MKPIIKFFAGLCALAAMSCTGQPQKSAEGFYLLKNDNGMEVRIAPVGARIASVVLADKDGVKRDVVLGFDTADEYRLENNETDFGASIGRYANRIQNGRFVLDGVTYDLPKNNYGHCLHGGPTGWQYKEYEVVDFDGRKITLKVESPDGDNQFPGNVTATVTYTLTDANAIEIAYSATTDAPTIINMTNHSYFNLSGDPENHSIEDDYLYINASNFTPVDSTFMTTGEIIPVEGTPMDFTIAHKIGDGIDADYEQVKNGNGYDHNWVLDTKRDLTAVAAEVYCEQTGIALAVYTDEPGIQVYTGNFLDGTAVGKGGVAYKFRHAICLETQHYPDSPNKPEWPSVVLRPGETYTSNCVFAFSVK